MWIKVELLDMLVKTEPLEVHQRLKVTSLNINFRKAEGREGRSDYGIIPTIHVTEILKASRGRSSQCPQQLQL